MKKIYSIITVIFCLFMLSITASAIEPLPEDEIAYCLECNTCGKKVGTSEKPVLNENGNYGECPYYYYNDDGSGYSCDGVRESWSFCQKEYFYQFKCTCGREIEYDELPSSEGGYKYGVCPSCKTQKTEAMFSIDYYYHLYYQPCYYCYSVQEGPKYVKDYEICPDCGESYDMTLPSSVDTNGDLIYGGGGDYLYYCTTNKEFYELSDNDYDKCDLCNKHNANKVTVLYHTTCLECGALAERKHFDEFKRPHLGDTPNNFGSALAGVITGSLGSDTLRELDYTNTCYECGHKFSDDENLKITRYVDAPKGAEYKKTENDGNFRDTDYYLDNGSEYDNFFQRIAWFFRRLFR